MSPLIDTSTGPVSYDVRGSGEPIVMLSSGAHDRHDWDELRALLPESYRTIALDWPSHGESPPGEVWGKRDPVIPLRVGRRIVSLIPGARLSVFDSGHVPHTTDPQRFAAELSAFADRVLGSARNAQAA